MVSKVLVFHPFQEKSKQKIEQISNKIKFTGPRMTVAIEFTDSMTEVFISE